MRKNSVYTPDGILKTFDLSAADLQRQIEAECILPYESLLLDNWLDPSPHRQSASMEHKVKNYLDRLGSLLLHNCNQYGILTERMQRRLTERERCLDLALEQPEVMQSKRVYKRKPDLTRDKRLTEFSAAFPNSKLSWRRVDTDGCFDFDGVRYRVSHPAYDPISLPQDIFYPMDRIGVILDQGRMHYYTQAMEQIAPEHITRLLM